MRPKYAAATSDGATALLALVESGQAPADLLQSPTIDQLLTANLTPSQQAIKNDLTTNLISNDAAMETRITKRIQSFQKHGGSAPAGQALFQKHCTVCHQLGGAGTILGPNLDGIGNRGLERLTEDVLNPSRNVDIAFRLTTLSLTDGSSQVGLIKRTEGTQTMLADPTGKESFITTSSIASKTSLTLSLMPATFADALSETEFRDLQAYLISLRN